MPGMISTRCREEEESEQTVWRRTETRQALIIELWSGREGRKAALRRLAASWHGLRADGAVKDAFGAAERLVL